MLPFRGSCPSSKKAKLWSISTTTLVLAWVTYPKWLLSTALTYLGPRVVIQKKLSASAACHAVHLVTNVNKTTAVQAAQELQHVIGKPLHAQTVCWALADAGLKSKKQTNKPAMSKEVMANQLAWAKAHKDWTVEDWKQVGWSNEATIKCHGSNGIHLVWVHPGDGLNQHTVDPSLFMGEGASRSGAVFSGKGQGLPQNLKLT
ncbi:hypothetical protein OPQ81_003789 [Rhizoctonia solani]|nr:hypothetical protein OPQ81_003789 [Rhizoctonia solani]